jgi:hypothetical protein
MLDLRTPWTDSATHAPALLSAGLHTPVFGFLPAFRDLASGETHLCLNPDGSVASVHTLDTLPLEWVGEWDEDGRAVSLTENVCAGFIRAGQFFTAGELILASPQDA